MRDTKRPLLSVIFLFAIGFSTSGLAISSSTAAAQDETSLSFNANIRPILSDRCFSCHGPDAESREAGLRLDQADGDEGAHAFAVVPGSLEDSELWSRVTSDDESDTMPPPNAHKPSLTKPELALVKQWIEEGANYDDFWAFEPPQKSEPPNVKNASWSGNPIDLYVLRKLESAGRQPSPEANLRQLIRRVSFDLNGLPPTRGEIKNFLDACAEQGIEKSWEDLVDELLSRPQYGEHIGRYWLDVVRFADTNGMHKDFYRNNTAYRDWVIRAFNENLSYADFIRYQIAGDLYENPTPDQLKASGFHRLHLIIDRGTALPEESFTKNVIDRVTSVGTGFMGLTVHCAQCHDHKYDPITQRDFYSLYAFFDNIDAEPETVANPKYGLQQPFVSFGTTKDEERLASLKKSLDQSDAKIKKLESEIAAQVAAQKSHIEAQQREQAQANKDVANDSPASSGKSKPDEKPNEQAGNEAETSDPVFDETKLTKLKQDLAEIQATRKPIASEFAKLDRTIPRAMVMKERTEIRPTYILNRGEYDSPGEEVTRDTPGFLPPLKKSGDVATRMDLAEWLVAEENPLTARVAVNRFWQQLFGVGIVKTSEDLGAQGEVPSHEALLDHLAISFVESGWDVKALIKQIVMTKTYRQSSQAAQKDFQDDPENRLLARGPRYRLDAEIIRDQILASSGLLSKKMYGRSVKPPQPDGLWKAVTMIGERYRPDTGEAIYRRSVYTYWKRGMPPPQMTILNAPFRDACITRRERTNTPSQALLLLNEEQYLNAARELALTIIEMDADNRIDVAWETITCQLPDESERETITSLLTEMTDQYSQDPALADQICDGVTLPDGGSKPLLAAWTMVISTLYNLDITKTQD